MKHHLMVGTWTPPGRIYTVQFDDEALTLTLLHKTDIPEAEPISWMTFSVSWAEDALYISSQSLTQVSIPA